MAKNGNEAMTALGATSYDVVVIDINMPEMGRCKTHQSRRFRPDRGMESELNR